MNHYIDVGQSDIPFQKFELRNMECRVSYGWEDQLAFGTKSESLLYIVIIKTMRTMWKFSL